MRRLDTLKEGFGGWEHCLPALGDDQLTERMDRLAPLSWDKRLDFRDRRCALNRSLVGRHEPCSEESYQESGDGDNAFGHHIQIDWSMIDQAGKGQL